MAYTLHAPLYWRTNRTGMTQQQAYEELRARLIDMGIKSKELTKGCHFIDKKGYGHLVGLPVLTNGGLHQRTESGEYIESIGVKKVYGTPITLQEILRGVDWERLAVRDNEISSEYSAYWTGLAMQKFFKKIDLTKDPQDYPPETLRWLLEVIPDNK